MSFYSQCPEAETLRRMKAILILAALLLSILVCQAQSKRNAAWITGVGGNFVYFELNLIQSQAGFYSPLRDFDSGSSCICDTSGKLIMYSDGFNLYDSSGGFMSNGDSLIPMGYYIAHNGSSLNSQSSIILPINDNKYYFITPAFSDARYTNCQQFNDCYFDLLLYNVVDMNSNGGLGEVTQRMVPLLQNAQLRKTQMMACRHGNGEDWWLLKNEGDNADVHTFLFTQDSVYDKGVQVFNTPVWGQWDIRGQSTFNSDGSMFATTSHGSSTGQIFLADFDRCYGKLTNPKTLIMPTGPQYIPWDTTITEKLSVGLAFSKNNQFLYVISQNNVYQYDLHDETWFHIAGLDTNYNNAAFYETAYMGYDNRIYIGNFGGTSKQMSRIDNPDVKGAGCNFCPRCLRLDSLGTFGYVGTPPCMADYGLGAKVCWPESSNEIGAVSSEMLVVYPNPASTSLTIELTTNKKRLVPLEMYNMVGELVLKTNIQSQTKVQINISSLPKGVYVIRCEGVSQKVVVE